MLAFALNYISTANFWIGVADFFFFFLAQLIVNSLPFIGSLAFSPTSTFLTT